MENELITLKELFDAIHKYGNECSFKYDFGTAFSSGVNFAIEKLEVKKLKQEHVEMVDMLGRLQKQLNGYIPEKYHDELEELLNKIKENGN